MHSSESLLGETVDNLARLEAGARHAFAVPLAEPHQQQRQPRRQAQQQQQSAARGAADRRRGLDSRLDLPPQLKEFWFPVDFSASLAAGKLVPIELFNEVRPLGPLAGALFPFLSFVFAPSSWPPAWAPACGPARQPWRPVLTSPSARPPLCACSRGSCSATRLAPRHA
jgi:hypothetical protein